jgi:hypothetical protein
VWAVVVWAVIRPEPELSSHVVSMIVGHADAHVYKARPGRLRLIFVKPV